MDLFFVSDDLSIADTGFNANWKTEGESDGVNTERGK